MKILVTGGAGYLGSVTSLLALSSGHSVRVIDNLLHGSQALPALVVHDNFEFIQRDLRETESVRRTIEGIDAIVHLAAIVGDPACSQHSDAALSTNYEASLELIRQAENAGVRRFVFASTCSNYGRMEDSSIPATEEHELRPLSLYAETKVAVETRLLAKQDGTMAWTILRFATLFGISPRMRFDLTVNEFVMRALTEGSLTVYGDQFWRPYVHVRDAARAILEVLQAPLAKVGNQVFNVGDTQENYRKRDLVDIIKKRVPNVHIESVAKAEDPRDYRVAFERIRKALGFSVTRLVPSGVCEIADGVESGMFSPLADPRRYNTVLT